jgi:MipA family protein
LPVERELHRVMVTVCGALLATSGLARAAEAETGRDDRVEGAIGLIVQHKPAYPGSSDFKTHLGPAGFVRWGRITVTGAGGFVTKRKDEVDNGLGAELVRRDDLRLSLNLRYESGRRESDSVDLAGMGNIRGTLRAKLVARWAFRENWMLTTALSADALGRVGGVVAEAGVSHQWRLSPSTTLTLGTGVSAANSRFMQAWHGVTPEQSAASGYAVYRPGTGLRDLSASAVLRSEFAPRWAGFAGFGMSRAVGPAADSPLTTQASTWLLSGGVVWRF